MIKQNKGKDLDNITSSRLSQGPYYVSIKYDGWYCQVQYLKEQDEVKMWTSGGKEFYLVDFAQYIKDNINESFHIECEFSYGCGGLLGDRGKSAKLTTYFTNYKNGKLTKGLIKKDKFRVLDLLDTDWKFTKRLNKIIELFYTLDWYDVPTQNFVDTLDEAKELARIWYEMGYEGAMCKSPHHIYQPGKRVNNIIKIKPRLTADLLCIDWKEGTGKYEGMIGSLLLIDSEGREVWAGSGLDDMERSLNPNGYIGMVIEIEYERIDDTYIQPIIKNIRHDKTKSDIT